MNQKELKEKPGEFQICNFCYSIIYRIVDWKICSLKGKPASICRNCYLDLIIENPYNQEEIEKRKKERIIELLKDKQ